MKPGILVISHGSREASWVALVDETVEAARAQLSKEMAARKQLDIGIAAREHLDNELAAKEQPDNELLVEASFLELVDGRLIQDGIDRLEAAGVTHIYALPLFVSSGSTHVDEIGWALGAFAESRTITDLELMRVDVPLTYGRPIDEDAELVDVLLERLGELSGMLNNEKSGNSHKSVLLIAHGSKVDGFREEWERGMECLCSELRIQGGYGDCEPAMLQLENVQERCQALSDRQPQNMIIAVPLFLSEGYFTKVVIPRSLEGLDCKYNGTALMPHSRISDWIARQTLTWLKGIEG